MRVLMAIDVEVRGFSGAYAGLNAPRTRYDVGMAEVINKAITVGGLVSGSALERTRRRGAISNVVLSTIRPTGAPAAATPLSTTTLYEHTETAEKAGISFRLGMAMAAVVAGRVLGTSVLKHVNARSGGAGRRADLIGLDPLRRRHVVEAKSRTYGLDWNVRAKAKVQAKETTDRLVAAGTPVDTFSASLTDLAEAPMFVLLEDPPDDRSPAKPLDFSEAEFLREFFSPVPDLLAIRRQETSGYDSVDEIAIGAWLPGADVWLGLARDVYARLRAGHDPLAEHVDGLAGTPERDDWLVSASRDGHVVVLGPQAGLDAT